MCAQSARAERGHKQDDDPAGDDQPEHLVERIDTAAPPCRRGRAVGASSDRLPETDVVLVTGAPADKSYPEITETRYAISTPTENRSNATARCLQNSLGAMSLKQDNSQGDIDRGDAYWAA